MSGHSEFAPIGNHNQPIPMPSVGGVGDDANQQANVQQVQQQGQPVVEEPNPPAARTLAQKLDSMLLKAATRKSASSRRRDSRPVRYSCATCTAESTRRAGSRSNLSPSRVYTGKKQFPEKEKPIPCKTGVP